MLSLTLHTPSPAEPQGLMPSLHTQVMGFLVSVPTVCSCPLHWISTMGS